MKKTFLSLLLTACLLFGLVGGLTVGTADEAPFKFSVFGNLTTELKASDNAFFDYLQKATNTEIDLQIPPSSNYAEALTIMMASGDYPDLVLFSNHTDVVYMDGVRNGVILPVNEYIANAPNLLKYSYDVSWKTLKVMGDDNIYGIPRTSIARADGMIIRKDWLDNVGITMEEGKPITLDQFTEMLDAFTNKDPDGNGQNDTYGLANYTGDGNLSVPGPIGWAFGMIGWQKYENEDYEYMDLTFSKKNDNYKRALEYMNYLWENKLVDPDWPTINNDAHSQRYDQGITGVRAEFAGWMPDTEARLKAVNPNAETAYIVSIVLNEGDVGQGGSFSTGFWGEWALMASAKDPQRIVDVLDFMLSDECWDNVKYGLEGVAWNYDNEGNKIAIPDTGNAAARAMLRRNDDPGFFVGLNTAVKDRTRIEDLIGVCIEQSVFSLDEGFRPAIADDPAYIDADKERRIAISKIIVGDMSIDEYDAVLEAWYAAGGQTYIEQMNEGIKANQ